MTTVIPSVSSSDTTSHVPSGDPPTSRAVPIARNPFARPKPPSSNSFTRTTLLPTHSPQRAVLAPASRFDANGSTTSIAVNGFETPAEKSVAAPGTTSASRDKRQGWRLLWRGGLEIGKEGWRLDGITFFALLSFPSTPSQITTNPFDVPISAPQTSSPFPSLPSVDTDLCLSLESMRGRKHLQVRGVIPLSPDEALEGEGTDEGGGVQLSISPHAPLLAAYFTTILCRNASLSPAGRTLSAIVIGLGDEAVEPNHNSTLLIYGQRHLTTSPDEPDQISPTLRLCVSRRRAPPPPPSAKKVRPGEPLPRPPLIFAVKTSKNALNLHSRRTKPLSRASSVSSIYLPPPPQPLAPPSKAPLPAPVSGRTPGRRGEKRKRQPRDGEPSGNLDMDERRRRSGKIVPSRSMSDLTRAREKSGDSLLATIPARSSGDIVGMPAQDADTETETEEDIFGKRPMAIARASSELGRSSRSAEMLGDDEVESNLTKLGEGAPPTGRKRARVPQQILDNKATIRKQALLMLEARGCQRQHELFKEVFSLSTKGAYFVFRDKMEDGPLPKNDIQRIIGGHLDMYLPDAESARAPKEAGESLDHVDDDEGDGGDRGRPHGVSEGTSPTVENCSEGQEVLKEKAGNEVRVEVTKEGRGVSGADMRRLFSAEGRSLMDIQEEDE